MTVVSTKSISGVTSITSPQADDAITLHTNDTTQRVSVTTGGMNVTGVITATSFDAPVTGDFSIADKIVHTGDTDTAIRFPAADKITFETAGAERLRVQPNGMIGIGTINATRGPLHIHENSNSDCEIHLTNQETGVTSSDGFTIFAGGDAGPDVGFVNRESGGAIEFYGHNGSSVSERLRITGIGSVGINETTPDAKVDILHSSSSNSATEKLIHLRTDPGGSYVTRGLYIKIGRDANYDNSAAHYDIVGSSGNSGFHAFEVQGNEKLRITKDGKVGIGTDVPAGILEIDAASTTEMIMLDVAGVNFAKIGHNTASGVAILDVRSEGHTRFLTNGNNERLRITNDEKFGFGLATPQTTIHVSQVDAGFWLGNPLGDGFSSGQVPTLKLYSDCSEKAAYIDVIWGGDNNFDRNITFGGSYLALHSPGASNGAETLRITGETLSTGGEASPDVSAGGLCLNQGAADTNILTFKSSDIAHGVTSWDQTDTYGKVMKGSANKGGLRIHGYTDAAGADPGVEIQGIIASDADQGYTAVEIRGNEANGTGVQNIATDRRIFAVKNSDGTRIASFTGSGLTFGNDHAVNNALQDYEVGTYTATVTLGSGSWSGSQNTLSYIKVGSFVHVQGRINGSTTNNDSSTWRISLPFANESGNERDTSQVQVIIRSSDNDGIKGIRIFRCRPDTAYIDMEAASGSSYGNAGTTTPHVNINFQYFGVL